MTPLESRITTLLEERRKEGLLRQMQPRHPGGPFVDLSNNDYLRLSNHPEVVAAAQHALAKWGASSSASPLITGYTQLHEELETRLSTWAGFRSGLIWNSGFAANHAVLSVLPSKGDLVLADRLIHHSMISGMLHSGAQILRFRHNDVSHLHSLLKQTHAREQVFVVTESVYSMDGDTPDLWEIAGLKDQFGFTWIVDEAHAIGWYGSRGSGMIEETGVTESVNIYVGTLGKALGSMGAVTLFHDPRLREVLVNFAGELIYSTYLPPSCAAAALTAIGLVESMSVQRHYGQRISRELRKAIPAAPAGDSPIVPIVLGDTARTSSAAVALKSKRFRAGVIRPPAVPEGTSRLRISLNTALSQSDVRRLATALQEAACR